MSVAEDNAALSDTVRQERDRAEAASEAKTRFFAAASHDLRQPLHALSINATTLDILAQRATDPLYQELILDKAKPDKAFYDRLHQAVQDILDKPKP